MTVQLVAFVPRSKYVNIGKYYSRNTLLVLLAKRCKPPNEKTEKRSNWKP
jgi:hypothetical protein